RTGAAGDGASRTPAAAPRTSGSSPHDGELLPDNAVRERRAGGTGEPYAAIGAHPRVGPRDERHLVRAGTALQESAALGASLDQHLVRGAHETDILLAREPAHERDESLDPRARPLVRHGVLSCRRGLPLAPRVLERVRVVEPHLLDERHSPREVVLGLAREPNEAVGRA